jgi:transcription-repair coupling factor (superfamily II helicase)
VTESPLSSFSLTATLSRASIPLSEAVDALGTKARVDITGAPLGTVALLLDRAAHRYRKSAVVLVDNQHTARRITADLRFFLGERPAGEEGGKVLLFPAADTSPFIEASIDRRAAMDRLSVLFHLAQKLPWKFLVLPISAASRRCVPRQVFVQGCQKISLGEPCDRDPLIKLMVETGYLRVPLVEDPGTFAVRGSIVDVYPPYLNGPVRVEFSDELVISIKYFDAENQRSRGDADSFWIHPVREAPLGESAIESAKERLSPLCDEVNLPSLKKRQLFEDLGERRLLNIDGVLPAFYQDLNDLFDYLPEGTKRVVLDPTSVISAYRHELSRAERDRAAKLHDRAPAFALEAHYLGELALAERMSAGPLTVIHDLAISGVSDETEGGALDALDAAPADGGLHIGAEDHSGLVSELRSQRAAKGADAPLQPLANRIKNWRDEGLRVVLAARTATQAQRLTELMGGYQIEVAPRPKPFDPSASNRPAEVIVVTGELVDGFILPSEALVYVTEQEIFGERGAKRGARAKHKRAGAHNWLEDLQQLTIGDYVVHTEHGVGRYVGLERKQIPLSRYDQLRGFKPLSVEVLTVEYAGGDKLFVPVTRLGQVSKYAIAEGAKPKLDKLGGQSFGRTKSRVRMAVRQLADELLVLYAARAARTREPLPPPDRVFAEFEASFPYEETPDQARAIDEVLADLQAERPMDRLVCGDVGFGKTEVALRAAFRTAMSGRQVALLCPTTVLAQQHFATFQTRLNGYPLRVETLSRFVPKKVQTETVAALKKGTCDVVIGTHRLLSKDIYFKNLGLLVVDEEQRFGVTHKERLKKLKTEVDVLTLSATPIPRTLHLAIGGLRELSLIATAPVDRRAVRTFVTRWDPHVVREAIMRELSRGGQVFFVNNRIERLYERARRIAEIVPEARCAVAHGQMRETSLEKVMTDFVAGRYDLLCSTAIIENGLDIPRANTILIDGADMFGMAQLYQLRGRVGRASERAYCYLIAPAPNQMTDDARARIAALERFSQLGAGFQLASLDMELRGAGDLLGAEQSGDVAAVGLELFVTMLEEAIAELRGEKLAPAIDPEITLDLEHYLPEEYVADIGVRLSLYKRFAAAQSEAEVSDLGVELEDRFGPPPEPARQFMRAMALKPLLRDLRVLGCEASSERVRLHFASDAPLDSTKLMRMVARSSQWQFTPDMRLIRRYHPEHGVDAIDRARSLVRELAAVKNAY